MTNETITWYQLDPAMRAEVAAQYRGVSLDHLNLGNRAHNALLRHDPTMDVAALLLADESIWNVPQLGARSLARINERMLGLLDESIPLEVYTPPESESRTSSIGTMEELPFFPEQVTQLPIGVLHLSVRTYKVFVDAGIATVGHVAHTPEKELAALKGVSATTAITAKERATILCRSTLPDGAVDWGAFCRALAIPMIPPAVTSAISLHALVRLLPKLVVQAMAHEENTHLQDVAEQRFHYGNRSRPTLEDLAQGFDMTRERVRQLEEYVLDFMRAALVEDNYTARPFHIHPDVATAFAPLWRHTRDHVASAISESAFDQSLIDQFNLHRNDVRSIKDLLLGMASVERISFQNDSLSPLLYVEPFPFAFDPAASIPLVHEILLRSASALTLSTLLIEVNRRLGKGKTISREELRAAVRLCSSVEEVDAGVFRCRFEALRTRADQFERVLIEKGEPITLTEIWRVINQRLLQIGARPMAERNVANQLHANSDRFEPIGRSGYWALKIWGVETNSIVTLMRQYLMLQNRSCSTGEITAYVLSKRPASENSITSYLATRPEFVKLDQDRWGLKEWGSAGVGGAWNRKRVATFVEEYFKAKGTDRVELNVLRAELATKAGITEKSAEARLARNPAITILRQDKQRLALLQPDGAAALQTASRRTKKTLRERMSDDCHALLSQASGKQMRLLDLIKLLQQTGGYATTSYHTFHSYVSSLPFIERYQEPDTGRLVVRMKDAIHAALADKMHAIQSKPVRDEVERAVFYLNEDTVDVGLFLLSKQFEVVLKQYVEAGAAAGAFSNQAPSDKKLVNLVAFVAKEKIVEDKPTLEYLRQARNERAHGAAPNLEQRKLLMSHVVADAGKYIDYIRFFDDQLRSLTATT